MVSCRVCLRWSNWRTELLGSDLSAESYERALKMFLPQALLISVSVINDEELFLKELKKLAELCSASGIKFILLGNIPTEFSAFVPTMITIGKYSELEQVLK